jgi:hypothetical protein
MVYQRHLGRFLVFPICGVLNEKKMDNVQKHSKCINMPSSQTFKDTVHFYLSYLSALLHCKAETNGHREIIGERGIPLFVPPL